MHNHVCSCGHVSIYDCPCAHAAKMLLCDVCILATRPEVLHKKEESLTEPSKIFKESLSIADLTEGKIVKYKPSKVGERGGIIITLKSEPLEAFIYELSRPRSRENPREHITNILEAPEVYVPMEGQNYGKHWGSEVPYTYEGQYFTPSFQPMPSLIGPNATFNLYMMRSVGLAKGVTWKYEGVFSAKECEIFTEMWEKTLERIYQQIFKGLEVTISIVPGVAA